MHMADALLAPAVAGTMYAFYALFSKGGLSNDGK